MKIDHFKYSLLFFFLASNALSQNLENLGKKEMLKVNGGLNYSSVIYNADGIPNRRQPYTWFVNGHITASVLDISLPFTFNYSNNQINYTQPYNIQSFNPSYKWIKGYAGITSMNFSSYTMAGHVFTGTGIELTPRNFKFGALYGRFKRATPFDSENNSDANMAFKRIGYGAYAGYEKNGHGIKLIYFNAKDDPYSIPFVPFNTIITPMENTVVSVIAKTKFLKTFTLETEYAISGLTRNILSPTDVNKPPKNQLPGLFDPNATSQFFSAFKSSLGYRYKIFGINFNYERIDPEYKTLGAYYFNNDMENFTLAPSLTLLKGKLNLNCNTGLQRNNLNKEKLNTTNRWVGSINLSYAPSAKWQLTGAYSNFSSYTKQRPQTDPFFKNTLDTLNFYQLSQSSMLSGSYNFGNSSMKQNIILTTNYMVTGQNQGSMSDPGLFGTTSDIKLPARVINGNLSHNLLFTESKTSITSGLNMNKSKLLNNDMLFFGPSLNLNRSFYSNSLKIGIGSTYNQVLTNKIKTNDVLNHRLNASYTLKIKDKKIGKFNFTASLNYMQKLKRNKTGFLFTDFAELTGNIGLSYNF